MPATEPRYRDSGWLEAEYVDSGRTGLGLADECGVTKQCIYKWLDRHGFDRRRSGPRTDTPACFYTSRQGYEIARSFCRGRYDTVYIHRLVAVAEFGLDAVKGQIIHHRNGIRWDNRPSNFEITGPVRHNRAPAQIPGGRGFLHTDGAGYERWRVRPYGETGGADTVFIHRLVAVAEYGFDAVAGNEVHHRNGVRWDNRPGNLEPRDPVSHGRAR